jgi:hypothetical protein
MYKFEIEVGEYDWSSNEKVTIETSDFEKIAIIQEFIEFQKEHGWCVDYDVTAEYAAMQCDEEVEEVEVEEYEVGDWYYDEDGTIWERVA